MNFLTFKYAFRNILKDKWVSLFNVIGFSIGIAACVFIFLFIKYESSYDNFHPNAERIYRVACNYNMPDETITTGFGWFPTAPAIKDEIPGIDDYCRISDYEPVKCYSGNQQFVLNELRFADANFFRFFNFRLLTGNPETILDSPDKIVLTEQKSRQIFGDLNPVGQQLVYNHRVFTVSGIADDPPANTHLFFDALVSMKYVEESDEFWKGWAGGMPLLSYLLLSEGTTPDQIEEKLPALLYNEINQKMEEGGTTISASLQNIEKVHLSGGTYSYDCSLTRSKKSIYVITSIGLLILLLAVVNYILLFTAQEMARTKDAGVLKIYGAGRKDLLAQIYAEVLTVAAVASLLGIVFLGAGMPFLNLKLKTSVSIGTEALPLLAFLILVIFILAGIITGLSARRIIAIKSIETIKNPTSFTWSGNVRGNFLIAFQFAAVIVLLISVFVISRQNKYLLNHELGFDKADILTLVSEQEIPDDKLSAFKQDLQGSSEIRSVSLSSQPVGTGLTQNGYIIGDESTFTMLNVLYTDVDFLTCFNIKLLEGENFSGNMNRDKDAILINQQLAKRAGWEDPLDKTLQRDGRLRVIGVVEDFNFMSLEQELRPVLIMANPAWDGWFYSVVNIRYQTSDIQGLIKQIDGLWQDRFPDTPFDISFFDDLLASNYQSLEEQQMIIGFFSLLGMLIAIFGLFGLTLLVTKKRTKEVGIRKVNGARVAEVMVMLNRDFVKWVAVAFVIASPIAWVIMDKWLQNFAYRTGLDWWIFAAAGLLAMGIALLTVSWQSYRAASRNPVEALRYE